MSSQEWMRILRWSSLRAGISTGALVWPEPSSSTAQEKTSLGTQTSRKFAGYCREMGGYGRNLVIENSILKSNERKPVKTCKSV